jgi:putative glycosyltransferase (TIGR04348 family)
VAIITPRAAATNAGNWHTAARWARFLRPRYRVTVAGEWDGAHADCLIALHARRSADSIKAFASAHPDEPLVVVLTGTDLYRDIETDQSAQRSLTLATHLVVLNELGAKKVPARVRRKTTVIVQSAPSLQRAKRSQRQFVVAVVGHLRAEKDPQLVWDMLRHIAAELPLRIVHAGAAYEERLGNKAAQVAREDARYVWLGDRSRAAARQLMRRAHVLLHPSMIEGGAQVVIEAVTAHTPVIASRIDGNCGLLGRNYPGLFKVGDAAKAANLIERAASEPHFMRVLTRACERRAVLFAPARERRAINRLIDNAIGTRRRKQA